MLTYIAQIIPYIVVLSILAVSVHLLLKFLVKHFGKQ
jgi:hypothetical protein